MYSTDAFFFTDFYLNLTGFQPVIDRSVVVHVPNRGAPRLGCAPLVEAENITLTGFRGKDGFPLANISQYSRYQDTVVSVGFLPSKMMIVGVSVICGREAIGDSGVCEGVWGVREV